MARYENGWIKVHRRAVIEDIGDNVFALGLWVMLLSLATWKDTKIIWNGEQRQLPPGTVVFGISEFSERWECSKSTVSKWLAYLHKTKRIILETSTRGCVATICNWEIYQSRDEEARTPSEHGANTARTPSEHGANLNEEGKKGRREEGEERDPKFSLSEENLKRAYDTWLSTLAKIKMGRANLLDREQRAIAQAIQRDGVNAVVMALLGVSLAPKDDFDSSWFSDVTRVLNPKNFLRFVNLGVAGANKQRESA